MHSTAPNKNIKGLKHLERESLTYCKSDGNVTFTRHFLVLDQVTFDEHVNVLGRYCKGDILYTYVTYVMGMPSPDPFLYYILH